jgi:hypothetical protein
MSSTEDDPPFQDWWSTWGGSSEPEPEPPPYQSPPPAFKTQSDEERVDSAIIIMALTLLKGLLHRSDYSPEVRARLQVRINDLIQREKDHG